MHLLRRLFSFWEGYFCGWKWGEGKRRMEVFGERMATRDDGIKMSLHAVFH